MKKIVIPLTVALFVLFAAAGAASAQEGQTQISITNVERLIDQKMAEEKPLTEKELTKALLEMKDEKIADLDGNVSKTIDLFAGFLAIAALLLAIVTDIIGWIFKRNVDDKLAKIEAKEENVNQKHTDILAKAASVEEHYKEVKKFRDDLEKFNKRLDAISNETEELKTNFNGLGDYVQTIEDITDGAVLMIQFINRRNESERIVKEAIEVIQQPQKHLQHTLLRLTKKLGGVTQFSNIH
ncbi:hypothetical protein RJP21_04510 [Paenibacillus sp. VCA1]|uniref:hypothetical protein n=1 Tax=Paenibacillus sp. VCA1 TaxID=3039148 RepID=UPI002871C384|nr:hypothetical protein [Paenibacillus sp. VCA1]MDR9852865.1 hypothetical protein [Paenibacillus sp. VCA1]